jgi:hypothetical protein
MPAFKRRCSGLKPYTVDEMRSAQIQVSVEEVERKLDSTSQQSKSSMRTGASNRLNQSAGSRGRMILLSRRASAVSQLRVGAYRKDAV